MGEGEEGVTHFGSHEIVWDFLDRNVGKCRVCGHEVTRVEVADSRNKDCKGLRGRAR